MNMLARMRRFLRKDERGSLSVEAVFAFPMLFWAATATFTFFDAFKAQNTSYRANYVISDMLSRETASIDHNYIEGLHRVFRYMTHSGVENSWIRVSEVTCTANCNDEATRILKWDWSEGVNGARDLTSADLTFYRSQIPLMAYGDHLILVETSREYKPPFAQALTSFAARDIVSHVVTRPRFAPKLDCPTC